MNPLEIIRKYYTPETPLYEIMVTHGEMVRNKALAIVVNHPELHADKEFVRQAAMLHDIGIVRTNAPDIHCHGTLPYLCHGVEGSLMLQAEGYPRHALVCERHTGCGISLQRILAQQLPLPHRNLLPMTLEEQIICYADKFYSKGKNLMQEKSVEKIRASLARYGEEGVAQFDRWCCLFEL